MSLQLSGTLHRPSVGDPLKNTRVLFRARVTSADTVMGATAEITTDDNGAYDVSLYSGRYDIGVYLNGHLNFLARDVLIDELSTAETLNELVLHDEYNDDITPSVIVEFRSLRNETVDALTGATALYASLQAVQAAQYSAGQSEIDAAGSATRSENASTAAIAAVNLQQDVAAGLSDTASGDAFSVAGQGGYLVLYRNNAGTALELSRYPGLEAFLQIIDTVTYALDLAGQAARQVLDDRAINQILSAVAAAHDTAGQAARSVPTGYLRTLIQQLHIDGQGRVGIGTNTPGAALDIAGGRLRLRESSPPASSSAAGQPGEHAWDSSYKYICVAANTWRRVAIQNW